MRQQTEMKCLPTVKYSEAMFCRKWAAFSRKFLPHYRLLSCLILIIGAQQAAHAQILLPENPKPVPAPSRGEAAADADLEERSDRLDRKLKAAGIGEKPPEAKEKAAEIAQKKVLLEKTLSTKPQTMAFFLNLAYTKITTRGSDRKDYDSEPSVGISGMYRLSQNTNSDEATFWLGARAQAFNGTGTYKGVPGRYSFLYFGPTVGVGKISPAAGDVGQDAVANEQSIDKALTSRHGFFAFTGFAAQSRQGRYEKNAKEPDDDLNSKAVAFDSPGLFAEFYYVNLRYNAISYNALLGVQTGKEKLFYYAGVGIGLWD